MDTIIGRFLLCTGAGAPKAPLCKGSWAAKLTEGLFHHHIDICTNTEKVLADFVIRNTNDSQSIPF